MEDGGKHFVFVHGLGHGAWCWYRVVAALRAAGHRATALDMAAAGAHPARVDEVGTFEEYSRPLLDAVAAAAAPGERLVLVGHSHGGLSVALAMERFPDKVAAAVFVAAAMPCVGKHMGVPTEEFMRRTAPEGLLMDCEMVAINNSQGSGVAINLGPTFLVQKYYQQSPAEVGYKGSGGGTVQSTAEDPDLSHRYTVVSNAHVIIFPLKKCYYHTFQDLALAKMLVRPGNQFMDDPVMKDESLLTNGNYGSVKKVYVIAKADSSSTEEMQRWMVAMSPGTDVEEIAGADHAVMNSKPRELCDILIKIANKYE